MINFRDLVAEYNLKDDRDKFSERLGPQFACEFNFLSEECYSAVYEPSEDTFLLIDSLHLDLDKAMQI